MVVPVLLCGSEAISKRDTDEIRSSEMRFLRVVATPNIINENIMKICIFLLWKKE